MSGTISYSGHPRNGEKVVKKTIQIITIHRDAPPVHTLSAAMSSTPSSNVTSDSSSEAEAEAGTFSLLWIPYVLIALTFIVFLGANFWCYHKKHRERYLRKRDEKRVKDGLHERRRITALMRSHFQTTFTARNNDDDNDDEDVERTGCDMALETERDVNVFALRSQESCRSTGGDKLSPVQSLPSPPTLSPALESWLWTNQNGSCRTNEASRPSITTLSSAGDGGSGSDLKCSAKRETSNGSILH